MRDMRHIKLVNMNSLNCLQKFFKISTRCGRTHDQCPIKIKCVHKGKSQELIRVNI